MRVSETIFYSGCQAGHERNLVESAKKLGYNLTRFEGFTRFSHYGLDRNFNFSAIQEIRRITPGRPRLWDCADEEMIRQDDAAWIASLGK